MNFSPPQRLIGNDVSDTGKNILPEQHRLNHSTPGSQRSEKPVDRDTPGIIAESSKIGIPLECPLVAVPHHAKLARINEAEFFATGKPPPEMDPAGTFCGFYGL